MKGTITIFRPDAVISEQRKLDAPPGLEVLHELVGGYIERVPLWPKYEGQPCVALCDEEGKLKNYPVNMAATQAWRRVAPAFTDDVLVGTVVVLTGDSEFMNAL
jgi:Domain of unknown function (DUF3846)